MTPKQAKCLKYIKDFWTDFGYSPSYDEIREALGLKSKSGVASLLTGLERQGYIVRAYNEVRSVTPAELAPERPEITSRDGRSPWKNDIQEELP